MDLQEQKPKDTAASEPSEDLDRRDLVRKLGKFAAYAAPFTILATTASAASGSGPGKHNAPAVR